MVARHQHRTRAEFGRKIEVGLAGRQHHERNIGLSCRCRDLPACFRHLGAGLRVASVCCSQISPADEQSVYAVYPGDIRRPINGFEIFDHGDTGDPAVLQRHMMHRLNTSPIAGARQPGKTSAASRISAAACDCPRLFDRVYMWDHDPHRARIECRQNVCFAELGNAHHGRDIRCTSGKDHQVGYVAPERGMLLVDNHEIVADRPQYLDHLRRGKLEECAEHPLAYQQSFTECSKIGTLFCHLATFRYRSLAISLPGAKAIAVSFLPAKHSTRGWRFLSRNGRR
ncbi:hypothetical protein LZK73_34105 (plasmid) [Neorhizobium galegae]|nr:hypothetical protein LZK73_34105 [Neorhizobium galegae]